MSVNSASSRASVCRTDHHYVSVARRMGSDEWFELSTPNTDIATECSVLVRNAIEQLQSGEGALSFVFKPDNVSAWYADGKRKGRLAVSKSSRNTSIRAPGTMTYIGCEKGQSCKFEVALCPQVLLSDEIIKSIPSDSATREDGSNGEVNVTFRPSKKWVDDYGIACEKNVASLMTSSFSDATEAKRTVIRFEDECAQIRLPYSNANWFWFPSEGSPSDGVWSINGKEIVADQGKGSFEIASSVQVRVHEIDEPTASAQSDGGSRKTIGCVQ